MSNMKGGVGKSTLAAALATELATHGDTLLIDCDIQASVTGYMAEGEIKAELADVLFGRANLESALTHTKAHGLYLLATFAGGDLQTYVETKSEREHRCFIKLMSQAEALGFDFVVCDMHPAMDAFERAALKACDETLVPIIPDPYPIAGFDLYTTGLRKLRDDEGISNPTFNRIIFNEVDRRIKIQLDAIETMKSKLKNEFDFYCFPVEPAFRRAQDCGELIQAMPNVKKETLAELKRLAMAVGGING
jgi:cellulose biosynthesis protein BcsQ